MSDGQFDGGKRRVAVTHHYETDMDVSRIDEWVKANYPNGCVQITDEQTGETLYDGF